LIVEVKFDHTLESEIVVTLVLILTVLLINIEDGTENDNNHYKVDN